MKNNSFISLHKYCFIILMVLIYLTAIKYDLGADYQSYNFNASQSKGVNNHDKSIDISNMGGAWVITYIVIVFLVVFREIQFIRQNIKEIFINTYINKSSSIHRFSRGKVFTFLFSIIPAILISVSLSVFMYLASPVDILIIGMSSIAYYFLYVFLDRQLKSHLSLTIQHITPFWVSSFVIIPATGFAYYAFHFFDSTAYNLASPKLVDDIVNNVKHSCTIFRNIVRTSSYIDLNIYTSKKIPGYGQYIFPLIYSVSASMIPFIGIALISQGVLRFMIGKPVKIKQIHAHTR